MASETYFPRGPVKTSEYVSQKSTVRRKFKENPSKLQLFKKTPIAKKKSEPKKRRFERKEYDRSTIKLNSVSPLQYETLQEGFLVVGCIKEIFSTHMTINLPGRLVGQVKINKISNPYCSLLSSYADGDFLPEDVPTLKDLFKIGELVTCCVLEVFLTERRTHKVLLSLNPSDINRDKTERILEENVNLVGAVKSKEDHGYGVDVGIDGVNTFLPFKSCSTFLKSQNCENLPIGKIIRVSVKKLLRANVGVSAIELTLDQDVLSKAVPRSGFTVDNVTPGQRMNVFIKQMVPNGIEVSPVHAFEDYCSYVHIAYVPDVWGNISDLIPGKVFSAVLLYNLKPVNILYFSLKTYSSELSSKRSFEDGTVIDDAKVIATANTAIFLQLSSRNLNAKGFVSSKQSQGVTNVSIGRSFKTRILHYDFLENLYICSLKSDVISADVFSTKELKLGQKVKCTVIGFKEGKGLTLKLGTLSAFAPLCHLTDHPQRTLNTVSNLFKKNSVVTAKVLRITEGNEVILTLKRTLLSSEALCQYEEAVVQKCYYGTILKVVDTGITVRFFGDVLGFVPNRFIASYVTGLSKESFHEGQVIRCYVVSQLERKLILSLIPGAAIDLKLGSSYTLEVVRCHDNGIEVFVTDTFISGCVPLYHVTDHLDLLSCIVSDYSSGMIIEDAVLYCFKEDLTPFFTLRTSVKKFIKKNPLIYSDRLSDLMYNLIVPCSVSKVEDSGIHLNITLPGFNDTFFLSYENISDNQQDLSNFKENQGLMAVIKPKDDSVDLDISGLNFINDFGAGLEILEDYLKQANKFQTISIGEKVNVKVTSVVDNEVNIKVLGKNLVGSFRKELNSKNYTKNDKFPAAILWQEPKSQHVYVHPDLQLSSKRVNEEKKSFLGKLQEAQVLLLLPQLVVGIIFSGEYKGQLTFIPTKMHFNDFTPKKPSLLSNVRVVPCKLVNELIISEREKRIKAFSKQLGENENLIISKLLGYNISEFNVSNVKEFSKKKRKQNSKVHEINETEIVRSKKNVRSTLDKNEVNFSKSDTSCEDISVKESLFQKSKNNQNNLSVKNFVSDKDNFHQNNSDEQHNINKSFRIDKSSENFSNKKTKKRKSSENEMEVDNSTFSLQSKVTDTISLNSVNISSAETSQCTNSPMKKQKKRKNSASFEQEDVIDDSSIRIASTSLLTTDEQIISNKSTHDSIKEENCEVVTPGSHRKRKKLVNSNETLINGSYSQNKETKLNFNNFVEQTEDDEDEFLDNNKSICKEKQKARLSLSGSGGFFWNVSAKDFSVCKINEDDEDEGFEEDDNEDAEKQKRPKSAAEKKAAAKETERGLRQAEQQLLEAELNPQSADHFERLTLAQPNNSLIWVKYMAYHLQATEIEKARAVANRALKIISHREEQERLNVWVALLNLENLYGTQETLKKTLEEAVRTNDEYQLYSKMAEIYTDSNKSLELDQLTTLMVKKFKTDLECWLLCCRCLLKTGLCDKARSIFQRGLQTLLKKEHVQYITRFALMENSFGSSEHAQTLMEHVLTSYPGRILSWITYVDMLTKSGQIDLARNVLERAVSQKLPVKKMKTLYKKWLQFEEQYGSDTSVNHVREAAEKYVNSLNAKIASV